MKHYNRGEWISYIENLSEIAETEQMEEHLISCEACLKQFVEILEEKEAAEKTIIPLNFAAEVMNIIEGTEIKQKSKVYSKGKILVYYTCAACITLFLMGSGAFTLMSKSIPMATAQIMHSPTKIEASLGKLKFNNMNFNFMNLFKTKL